MSDPDTTYKWQTISVEQANTMTFIERSWEEWKKQYTITEMQSDEMLAAKVKVITDDREGLHALIGIHARDKDYCIVFLVRKAPYIKSIVQGVDIMIDIDKYDRAVALAKGAMRRLHVLGLNAAVFALYGHLGMAQAALEGEQSRLAPDKEKIAKITDEIQKLNISLMSALADVFRWSGLQQGKPRDDSTTSVFT